MSKARLPKSEESDSSESARLTHLIEAQRQISCRPKNKIDLDKETFAAT